MKRIITIYFTLLFSCCLGWAQTMEQYMSRMMPSSTQLKQDQLAQLLSMGSLHFKQAVVVNLYGDTTRLLSYEENNYALVQLSDQRYASVKRWQIDDTTQLCGFSSWVCGTMCDGWWRFQTLGNRKIEIPKVDISDFYDKELLAADGWTADSLSRQFEMIFLHCEFGKSDSLYIYCDTERYLEQERKKQYAKYFKGNCLVLLPVQGRFSVVAVGRREDYNEAH